MHLSPLTAGGFGVAVVGVDLAQLPDADFARLHTAFLESGGLLLVRGQAGLCPAAVKRFAARFGALEDNEKYFRMKMEKELHSDEHREILSVGNKLGERSMMIKVDPKAPLLWHCDDSFRSPQPMGSAFFCVEAPLEGAATVFASGRHAFLALPANKQKALDKLVAIHDYNYLNEMLREENPSRPPLSPEVLAATPPVLRPLVAVHPATRVPALYVPDCHISKILDANTGREVERESVVPELLAHVTQDAFVYRHQWAPGDLVVWDNRSTLHAPTHFDDTKYERLMWRLTMHGEQILPSPESLRRKLAFAQAAASKL